MKHSLILIGVLCSLQLYLADIVSAQVQNSPQADATTVQQQIGAGDVNRPTASATSGIQLNATTTSNQAAVNLAGPLLSDTHWSLLLTSPISMGNSSSGGNSSTNTNITTLDGLANGFAAKGQISQFKMFNLAPGNAEFDAIVARANATCLKTPGNTKTTCDNLAPGVLIESYDRRELKRYLEIHFPDSYAITYGAQIGVGYNNFTEFNPSTLAKSSQSDVPWSIRGYFGYMPWVTIPALVTVAANYQQAYTAAPTATKCVGMTSMLNCQTGAFSAPTQMNKMLLSVDLHSQFSVFGHSIGFGPQITYDTIGHQTGIDAPIYSIPDTKGNLIGGIDLGWTNTNHTVTSTSSNHGFTAGVIVGVPFTVF